MKKLKEAFEGFPVEEEWHKGKIENKQILFKIGKLNNDKIEEYKKSFYDNLKENN